ncbi:CD226 antigen-like isoform X1 [Tachysurus fulvidraco]|uniref:CD226 antigen-like isoform X1 n=1 Tax=Tachysurus fulvidraco TaxID=1234273 RepID=UPI001FEE1155|nr:CD226 antigen-like isoform X1 [Tachysurus fulvidraco]XP_047673222.1 CD226 antigen-like isoform X1 [Tachysurus fulvidraco]
MKWLLIPCIIVMIYLLMQQFQAFIVIESMVNEALTLPCNCSGNCPVVQWIRFIPDNVVIVQSWMCLKQENFNKRFTLPEDTSRGDFSLMISSVAYTDAGYYMCSCNEKSVTEVELKVIIATVVKAFEGKNVTLPCYGDTRQVVKDVKWKKDGHKVLLYTPANRWMTTQNRFTMSVEGFLHGDLSLHICPVHLSDTGLYQCLIHDESQDGEPRAVLLKVEELQQFTTTNSAPDSGWFVLPGLFISVGINIIVLIIYIMRKCRDLTNLIQVSRIFSFPVHHCIALCISFILCVYCSVLIICATTEILKNVQFYLCAICLSL